MIAIRAEKVTPRLNYVLNYIFSERLALKWRILSTTQSPVSNELVIDYARERNGGEIFIQPEGLCFESGLRSELPEIHTSSPRIFENASDLGFDVFSAVFFCLSRYEEYFNQPRDEHGRFLSQKGLFYPFRETPYVDHWIKNLADSLIELGVNINTGSKIKWINTLDIDIAFAYAGRDGFRFAGAIVKDLLAGNVQRIAERAQVIVGQKKDPFDTYDLFEKASQIASESIAFVPVSDKTKFDINLQINHPGIRSLLNRISHFCYLGLHPSYYSSDEPGKFHSEKEHLENGLQQPVFHSRQHFLRFSLPSTFRALAEAGIQYEYSMGFHDCIGFRAGTAYPFFFYDLENEFATDLELFPLIAMDSAMKNYMGLEPDEALSALHELIESMRSTGGYFTSVWHNHSLSDRFEWEGWQKVYKGLAKHFGGSS